MLVLAAAAARNVRTRRSDTIRRRLDHAEKARFEEILFILNDLDFDFFSGRDIRNEAGLAADLAQAFAAEDYFFNDEGLLYGCRAHCTDWRKLGRAWMRLNQAVMF
jgi:hypothetical protein